MCRSDGEKGRIPPVRIGILFAGSLDKKVVVMWTKTRKKWWRVLESRGKQQLRNIYQIVTLIVIRPTSLRQNIATITNIMNAITPVPKCPLCLTCSKLLKLIFFKQPMTEKSHALTKYLLCSILIDIYLKNA